MPVLDADGYTEFETAAAPVSDNERRNEEANPSANPLNRGGALQYLQQGPQLNPAFLRSTAYPDFADLVSQVRENDPGLSNRVLEPDGYFQTRRTTLSEITDAITELNATGFRQRTTDDLPTVVVGWGKCRVGSTALTNLFGMAGVLAYYNPIKTAVRHFVLDGPAEPWHVVRRTEHEFMFAKEMSGPYHLADCMINPLKILVEAGYPTNRIKLVMLDRDPYRSLDSWLNKWSHLILPERLVQHYVLSALNAIRIKAYATEVGIPIVHYMYEASRLPQKAVNRMFRQIGMGRYFHNGVVEDWNEKGSLASLQSKIIFPPLPKPCVIPGLHASEARYLYKERSVDRVSVEHRKLIEETGVLAYYQAAALACADELQLGRDDRKKLFEGTPAAVADTRTTDRRHAADLLVNRHDAIASIGKRNH